MLEEIEIVSGIINIIASVGAAVGVLIKAQTFFHQTHISLTLLTYEERKKHQLIEGLVIRFAAFIVCFFLVFEVTIANVALNGNADIKEETNIEQEEMIDEKLQDEEQGNDIQKDYDLVATGILIAVIIVSAIITVLIRNNEKKNPDFVREKFMTRYYIMFVMLVIAFFVLILNILFAIDIPLMKYTIINGLLSLVFALSAGEFLLMLSKRYRDDIALLKTEYKNRIVYLFGMKDDCFVAGDSIYVSECKSFILIKTEELEGHDLVKAKREDDIFLLIENVSCLDTMQEEDINDILRCISIACKKQKIKLTLQSKISIVGKKKKKIIYQIDGEQYEADCSSIKNGECESNVFLL